MLWLVVGMLLAVATHAVANESTIEQQQQERIHDLGAHQQQDSLNYTSSSSSLLRREASTDEKAVVPQRGAELGEVASHEIGTAEASAPGSIVADIVGSAASVNEHVASANEEAELEQQRESRKAGRAGVSQQANLQISSFDGSLNRKGQPRRRRRDRRRRDRRRRDRRRRDRRRRTKAPTKNPTKAPTKTPTKTPTKKPTKTPTKKPTKAPTTKAPTTKEPTTAAPTQKQAKMGGGGMIPTTLGGGSCPSAWLPRFWLYATIAAGLMSLAQVPAHASK
jgi:hypothetical protein